MALRLQGGGRVARLLLRGVGRPGPGEGPSFRVPARGAHPPAAPSTLGTGGSVCVGLLFKRLWFKIINPSLWSGKALCVRPSWANYSSMCQTLGSTCNCLPYLKKQWKENVFLVAEGSRYNLQVKSNHTNPHRNQKRVCLTYIHIVGLCEFAGYIFDYFES